MELSDTKFGKLKAMVDGAVDDYMKAQQGNKAAGVRVRKVLQEVKLLAHDTKKELLGLRKKED